jgi:hypothetical protein
LNDIARISTVLPNNLPANEAFHERNCSSLAFREFHRGRRNISCAKSFAFALVHHGGHEK